MQVIQYNNAIAFQKQVLPTLLQNEALNNLPIGVLQRGIDSSETGDWFMAHVTDRATNILLVVLMTPPRFLMIVSPAEEPPQEALTALAEHLIQNQISLPGILGEYRLAHAFAQRYADTAKCSYKLAMDELCYKLTNVVDLPYKGKLRPAHENDLYYLPYWLAAFHQDCFHQPAALDYEWLQSNVQQGNLYVLENDKGMPVSLAGTSRQMPHGRSIGPVYTPPFFRGQGYASACTAMLSQLILDQGYEYCVLFADRANPTSNGVYQRIGYKHIGNFVEIAFE